MHFIDSALISKYGEMHDFFLHALRPMWLPAEDGLPCHGPLGGPKQYTHGDQHFLWKYDQVLQGKSNTYL